MPDSSPFGIHKTDLSEWPRMGAKWVRLWDTGDTWNVYEPVKGDFRWAGLDKKIADAQRQSLRLLYVLAYTLTWASARVTDKGYCVEIVVPMTLAAGRKLRFDIAVDDADELRDGRPARKAQIVYHGTANDFQDPSAYAVVVLGK